MPNDRGGYVREIYRSGASTKRNGWLDRWKPVPLFIDSVSRAPRYCLLLVVFRAPSGLPVVGGRAPSTARPSAPRRVSRND